MSEEYADPAGESEMRRRAAWLLGMLVLVAVLLVALMVFFLRGGGGHGTASPSGPPLPTGPVSSSHSPSSTSSSHTAPSSASNSTSASSPETSPHKVHCPTDQTCAAQGDAGDLLGAINAYRRQNGQSAVSGSVSDAAKTCALTNGAQCTGSWAESEVPAPNGREALQKIIPLSHDLLAPNLSGLEVGWAYDPAARLYYFAVITDT